MAHAAIADHGLVPDFAKGSDPFVGLVAAGHSIAVACESLHPDAEPGSALTSAFPDGPSSRRSPHYPLDPRPHGPAGSPAVRDVRFTGEPDCNVESHLRRARFFGSTPNGATRRRRSWSLPISGALQQQGREAREERHTPAHEVTPVQRPRVVGAQPDVRDHPECQTRDDRTDGPARERT